MPNLNAHSKLITPGQALVWVILGCAMASYYYDVDVVGHLGMMRESLSGVLGWVVGS